MRRMKRLLLLAFVGLTGNAVHADNDPRDSNSPYGVLAFFQWNHDWNQYHYNTDAKLEHAASLAHEAGIRWIRMDFLWADIEPQKGRFDFDKYDHILDILEEHGLKVMVTLEYNPSWRDADWNAAPVVEDYVYYARKTVRHFKDRVKYWEIWNEPDSVKYWTPQDDMTAYSRLLKAVYPVIKEEDPTAQVLVGGLSDGFPFRLRSIYKKAGRQYFDVVNLHPFISPLHMGALTSLRGIYVSVKRVMEEFDDKDKPIWFTEIGCPGVQKPTQGNGWWGGRSPTEAQQAQWLERVYRTALKWPGVEKIFWAFLRETPGFFGNGVDTFGLIRKDFSTKPAWESYKKITRKPRPLVNRRSRAKPGKTGKRSVR